MLGESVSVHRRGVRLYANPAMSSTPSDQLAAVFSATGFVVVVTALGRDFPKLFLKILPFFVRLSPRPIDHAPKTSPSVNL